MQVENESQPDFPASLIDDMANNFDSDLDEDEYEKYKMQQPFRLKQIANEKYREGKYEEAIKLWMQSVKETLKLSVRTPSAALYQNQVRNMIAKPAGNLSVISQILCRLNMAMGYLKLGEWVEAKGQAEIVLEQRPTNVKGLYRMALALEKLQDWTACESVLQKLVNEAERGEKEEQTKNETENKEDENLEDSELRRLDLEGFTPTEIYKLVNETKKRLARDKAVYKQRAKKVFGGIGAKLDQIGASEGRLTEGEKEIDRSRVEDLDEKTLDEQMKDLIGKVDLRDVVKWNHRMNEEERKEMIKELDQGTINENKEETNENLLSAHATPILKDVVDDDFTSDDPNDGLWTKPKTATTLKADKRSMILSLPFTLLRVIELGIAPMKALTSSEAKDDEIGRDINAPSTLTDSDLLDTSKRGRLQRRLIRSLFRRRHLTIHLVGVRGDTEMECNWTSVLKRIFKLRSLLIVCIGFNDPDDRWSKTLKEGIISPPLTKSKGLSDGKKLTCRLYKGLYQLFLNEYPDVLSSRTHPFHPDLVLIPEPRLSRYFDSWISVFNDLINHEIPTCITGYSAVDCSTHDAQNLPPILKALHAEWAIPLQPNPYAIKVQPESDFPPMTLWAPPGEQEQKFDGISAKNAVLGVFFGYSTEPYELRDSDALKAQLRPICDIESEELAIKLLNAEKNALEEQIQIDRESGEEKDGESSPVLLKPTSGQVTTVQKEQTKID